MIPDKGNPPNYAPWRLEMARELAPPTRSLWAKLLVHNDLRNLATPFKRLRVRATIIDRIVGVNVIGTQTIAVILLIGIIFDQVDFFIDIAFVYALINFIGTLAFSKYFEKKGVEHGGSEE